MDDMENVFSMHSDCLDVNRISLDNGLQQGVYFIGPKVTFCNHPIKDITECIAKRENSEEYVVFKILNCTHEKKDSNSLGKILLHNERVVLSLLQDKQGVIHHHGLFKYYDKFILVLDCVMSHEHDKKGLYKDFINLQQYVIQKKQLRAMESLEIFCSVMSTLKMLHEVITDYTPGFYTRGCSTFEHVIESAHSKSTNAFYPCDKLAQMVAVQTVDSFLCTAKIIFSVCPE